MKTYFDPTCRFSSSFKCLLVIFYSGSHQLFHFPIFLVHFHFCLHVPCVCVHNILRNPSKVIKRRPFHFSYYLRWCFCLGCFLSTWYVSLPPFCVCLSINLMRILFVWPSNVNIISRWLYIGVWIELYSCTSISLTSIQVIGRFDNFTRTVSHDDASLQWHILYVGGVFAVRSFVFPLQIAFDAFKIRFLSTCQQQWA